MKNILRKKQGGPRLNLWPLKQLSEAAPGSTEDETSQKKYLTMQRKSRESGKSHSQTQPKTSGNMESKPLKLRYDNPDFCNYDTISINQGEEASTSKTLCYRINSKKEKSSGGAVRRGDTNSDGRHRNEIESRESRIFLPEHFQDSSRSKESVERLNENLLLKKTDEITNFSFNNCEVDLTNDNGLQYAAERLILLDKRKSSDEFTGKSDFFSDENLINEINMIDSEEDEYDNDEKFSSSAASLSYDKNVGMNELMTELKGDKMEQNLWSNINKFQIVNFFFKKQKQTKRSKFTHTNANRKGSKKAETVQGTFVDPKVSAEDDLEIKKYLRDFLLYIIYLIFITTIAMGMVSSNMYYFTEITTSLFFDTKNIPLSNNLTNTSNSVSRQAKTLRESKTFDDFWAFAESTLINMLYWDFYYPRIDSITHSEKDDKKMFYENQILGVARLRQVRVKSDSCAIHHDVKRFFNSCFYYYSVFSEETEPIKKGMEGSSTATAWVYTDAKTLNTSYYWGEISVYGGGGYYLDLSRNKEDSLKMIKELKENLWLGKATRAIFIDFNIYNANANLFCLCKIVLEFPPVGGMIPNADFQSLKLIRYLSVFDFFIMACEILHFIFVVYYTAEKIILFNNQKKLFFFSFWNYIDVIILLLSYTYIALNLARVVYAGRLISKLDKRYNQYTEFQLVKEIQINFNNVIAVLLFFSWVKLFMYFNFNEIMLQFRKTLARSLKDILAFFPMFLIMFLAFSFLAYLLFGNQVKDYNTVWSSFLTLLEALLGEFNYNSIMESNPVVGPLFYVTFIFFIFFVLLNVFIAIINDAYTSVKSQVIPDSSLTGEYIRRGFYNIFSCCPTRLSRKLSLKKTKKKLLFQEIESALKKAGFSSAEIKIFFFKYKINYNNFLSDSTKKKIIKDLELKRIDFSETSEQAQINTLRRTLENLRARMEDLEMNLQPVIDKVDILLQRM